MKYLIQTHNPITTDIIDFEDTEDGYLFITINDSYNEATICIEKTELPNLIEYLKKL